ncbi:hypothetical protein PaecuDRAFT_1226 [Paenibacillus curdlanolyticus YK9]|uniref:Lipoprotein n=1 Tax=Paenibacillus curdlanolyticus YK9 TaxID=717606 RepID=E0I6F4_9BACL|nr:hypothetical protein [Paenibacillus curdlanolyticus]EFM11620.1 hypothetical protein PaecuDRAFT_1226 [Paenibacillus curdlanolyticus YK9]
MYNRMKKAKWIGALLSVLLTVVLLTGCGDEADVSVFIMAPNGMPDKVTTDLQAELQPTLGEKTIKVVGSPIYNAQKLLVEYIAGEHAVMALPKSDYEAMIGQGGGVPLEDIFDEKQYSEGVMVGTILKEKNAEVKEKHLFGIPLKQAGMFKKTGFAPEEMFLIIPTNAPDLALSKQVIKELVHS